MIQKSYDGKPTLYLVPTPIGNMEDITLRAINIFKEVEVILSEDTRVTKELLKKLDIKKQVISNYEYNEEKNKEIVLEYLKNGKSIALVSDRGTPVISDPGYVISSYIISQGFNVVALPGATALIPALIVSNLTPHPFTFYGFLNNKETKRKKELEELKNVKQTLIFYEAPHRISEMLKNMLEIFGNRNISISREITKKHEEVLRGTIEEVLENLKTIKGEFVIVVDGNKNEINYNDLKIEEHINFYLNQNYDLKEAMKMVAKSRKVSKSEIYKEYQKRDV